jgi:hypothetical protein
MTRFGKVRIVRNRLRNKNTGQSLTPSAIAWHTSHHSSITAAVKQLACHQSQQVSYHKTQQELAALADEATLISKTTAWNLKQEEGQRLSEQQRCWFEHPEDLPLLAVPGGSPVRIAKDTLQVQLDEVVTKSQEKGAKENKTFTATIETDEGGCFYLAAESSVRILWLLFAYLHRLGIDDKKLEVISDGATWITAVVGESAGAA